MLPTVVIGDAASPSRSARIAKRFASASVCARMRVNARAAGRISAGQRAAAVSDFGDRRAFASTVGTPRRTHAAIRFGQISVSITTPTTGRQCARNDASAYGAA